MGKGIPALHLINIKDLVWDLCALMPYRSIQNFMEQIARFKNAKKWFILNLSMLKNIKELLYYVESEFNMKLHV